MYRIRKNFRVPIGHRLSKHLGACKSCHGHNLFISVQISKRVLNTNDMVMDFKDFKNIINNILDDFDHAMVLNSYDKDLLDFMKSKENKVKIISNINEDPTAEVLSRYLFDEISGILFIENPNIKIDFVRVWENDDSMAEYSNG